MKRLSWVQNAIRLPDTGLYYFNARWYSPNTGRFITEDPARDGLNWMVYCSQNPLIYVDPTGLMFTDTIGAGGGGGTGLILGAALITAQNREGGRNSVPINNRPNSMPPTNGPPIGTGDTGEPGGGNGPKFTGPGFSSALLAYIFAHFTYNWFFDEIDMPQNQTINEDENTEIPQTTQQAHSIESNQENELQQEMPSVEEQEEIIREIRELELLNIDEGITNE